jgi:hypothetical protein
MAGRDVRMFMLTVLLSLVAFMALAAMGCINRAA